MCVSHLSHSRVSVLSRRARHCSTHRRGTHIVSISPIQCRSYRSDISSRTPEAAQRRRPFCPRYCRSFSQTSPRDRFDQTSPEELQAQRNKPPPTTSTDQTSESNPLLQAISDSESFAKKEEQIRRRSQITVVFLCGVMACSYYVGLRYTEPYWEHLREFRKQQRIDELAAKRAAATTNTSTTEPLKSNDNVS